MSLTIKCIDLFCGCGGMSLGFEASGFNIVAGIDNWKAAIRVYEKNFDHPIIEKDLMDVEGATELIAGYAPDLIIGGPPCQDFSTAGFQDESRGRAILSICYSQIVSLVRPKYFVMENVATIRNTKSFQSAIANFRAAGYGLLKWFWMPHTAGFHRQERECLSLVRLVPPMVSWTKNLSVTWHKNL